MPNDEPLVVPDKLRIQFPSGQVKEMPLDEYLKGVLPAEIGLGKPLEALKAQAISARSYAVVTRRHARDGFDVCTTTHCQVWKPERRYADADRAVDETAGKVITYQGRLVGTHYFGHCDGRTRNSEDVWSGKVAYLRSVSCICGYTALFGHGVGMCQRGVVAMAKQGTLADEILKHYYTDVEIAQATVIPRGQMRQSVVVGRVVDGQGRPRRGLRLVLEGGASPITRGTTADGRYWFTGLPAGHWTLRVKGKPVRYADLHTDGRSMVYLEVAVPDAPPLRAHAVPLAYPRQLIGTLGYKGVPVTIAIPDGSKQTVISGSADLFDPGGFALPVQPLVPTRCAFSIRPLRWRLATAACGCDFSPGRAMTADPTLEKLQAARAERYRQRPHLRVRTQDEALEFLNDVGLCLLFSAKDVELPSLWGALCGEDRSLPSHHDSRELGLAWHWKDELPVAGKVLYGKFLRKRPVFVSLDLAPYFYALSPNYGDLAQDYLQDYQDGRLSVEAKQVYKVLLDQGALPTSRLRREAGLSGKSNASRFDRALAELQMDFRITKVAISDANRWGYCYVYDLLPRHFPEVIEAARAISGRQARETILLRYLHTVIAARPHEVRKLFGWQPGDIDRLTDRLATKGRLRQGVRIEGLDGEYLVRVL